MQFNFSDIWWLALVLAVPAVTALYALYYRGRIALERLKAFADAHLLPHLLKNKAGMQQSIATPLILWSVVWVCGALAMAGPRWNYTDIETGIPDRSLVILLDLSKSMDAQDVKPSRLGRAKEEIGDIIDARHGTNIGLIAFAAIPHMVAPLTDDMATIRYLMPSLDTNLVGTQGSRLAPAIEMAGLMLRAAPGKEKSILVVSDGGMVDLAEAARTVPQGVTVYALGVGTSEGAPIPSVRGGWIERRNGEVVIATLEADKLQAVADAGKGFYIAADYTDGDTHALLSRIEAGPEVGTTKKGRTVRVWDEKFYIPVMVMALIMLPWFRRGYVFPVAMLLTFWTTPARADVSDMFMNKAQQARAAYDQRDYESAAQNFDTPYRRGVSQYRAGQFDKAEQSFAQDNDPNTKIDSEYNKGNAQLMQGRADDAIASYEAVLKQRPEDQAAAKNLEIAKKLREQQQKKDDQKQDQKQDQQKDQQKDAKNDQKQNQKQDKKQDQKQQDKQQQQAQNNQQQQDKSGEQQQDKQGQQQQKDQKGENQQQDKQGEQQQKADSSGQPQDKQQQNQQSQNGEHQQQNQAQNGQGQDQSQDNQSQQGPQEKDQQQQAQNKQGDQQGQQHNDQQQGQPDKDKGQQQAQNGQDKDKNNPSQDQKGASGQKAASDQKDAKNDQQYPPQPGSAEDKKNQAGQQGGSEKHAQEQNGGADKDKQQAAQQGNQNDQKQEKAQNPAQQQAQQKPGQDKNQQEQTAQQAQQGEDKQKQQAAQASGGQDSKEQAGDQPQPSYSNSHQNNSSRQQQPQQAYDSSQPDDSQSANGRPGQVFNSQSRPRSQKDVDADQWLNRAVSDPGPFLKNQFSLDARRNPQPLEEDPW